MLKFCQSSNRCSLPHIICMSWVMIEKYWHSIPICHLIRICTMRTKNVFSPVSLYLIKQHYNLCFYILLFLLKLSIKQKSWWNWHLLFSRPTTLTLLTSMFASTVTLMGLWGTSLLAKYTSTVYCPGLFGSYSTLKVPSWLSIVLTGTSTPRSSVTPTATSPARYECLNSEAVEGQGKPGH